MPFIVSRDHLSPGRPFFDETRRISTTIVSTLAEELHKQGFSEVLVADSHGEMVNLDVEKLPEYVEVIRGFPRPTSMVACVEEAEAVLFVGYHAKFGTEGSAFDHTYSGRVYRSIHINEVEVSEFLLNAYVAGFYGKPVILVAGDVKLLEDDVAKHAPWAVRVPLKTSLSRFSARSPSLERVKLLLKESVTEAVRRLKAGEAKPLTAREPLELRAIFNSTSYAEVASLVPKTRRTAPLTVEYTARDIVEAYKLVELWALAAMAMER